MEYSITCCLAHSLDNQGTEALDRILGKRPRPDSIEVLTRPPTISSDTLFDDSQPELTARTLLFAYHFNAPDVASLSVVAETIISTFGELAPEFEGRLSFSAPEISVQRGSIDIVISFTQIAITWTIVGVPAAALTVWAAEKLVGGIIEEFGKEFANSAWERLHNHDHSGQKPTKKGRVPQGFHEDQGATDYQEKANQIAQEEARKHQCRALPIIGGVVIFKQNSHRVESFAYGYSLKPRGVAKMRKHPQYIYVKVSKNLAEPAKYYLGDERVMNIDEINGLFL